MIFKITYYDDPEYSICNLTSDEISADALTPLDHNALLTSKISKVAPDNLTVKINVVVNNILLHIMEQVNDKMKLLASICEFVQGSGKMLSTRRLARILLYLGLLYSKIESSDMSQFLTNSIYSVGGLLKIEVRNYL